MVVVVLVVHVLLDNIVIMEFVQLHQLVQMVQLNLVLLQMDVKEHRHVQVDNGEAAQQICKNVQMELARHHAYAQHSSK